MNILVSALLRDHKLESTLDPLINIDVIENIFLIRRFPLANKSKVVCYSPPGILQKSVIVTEFYRFFTIIYLCLFKRVDRLIGTHFYFHCVYVAVAGLLFNKPYILSIIEDPKLYRHKWSFRYLIKRAKAVAVRGSRSKEFLETQLLLPEDKVFILPDVFPFQDEDKGPALPKKYDLIYIGYFDQAKRIDVLLQVLDKVKSKIPQLRSVIIGRGPLREKMVSLHQQMGLGPNVEMPGFVDDIYSYLRSSRAFIMTSQTEGLPSVLIEAMSCGIPCIVPDVGDIKDLAKDNYNALLVEPLNADRFCDACVRLLTDEKLCKRLTDNLSGFRSEKEKEYSLENVSEILKKYLKE